MSQHTKSSRLREAIRAYRAQHNEELDEDAHKLLTRLASSNDAAKAFEWLKPKEDDGGTAIIRACIEAQYLVRNFTELTRKAKKAKKILEKRRGGRAGGGFAKPSPPCVGCLMK